MTTDKPDATVVIAFLIGVATVALVWVPTGSFWSSIAAGLAVGFIGGLYVARRRRRR